MAVIVDMWLDDIRDPAEHGHAGWYWVRTVAQAQRLLELGGVRHASLDHDLGCKLPVLTPENMVPGVFVSDYDDAEPTGYDLVCWMERTGHWPRERPTVHSANPPGAARMRAAIARSWRPPS